MAKYRLQLALSFVLFLLESNQAKTNNAKYQNVKREKAFILPVSLRNSAMTTKDINSSGMKLSNKNEKNEIFNS